MREPQARTPPDAVSLRLKNPNLRLQVSRILTRTRVDKDGAGQNRQNLAVGQSKNGFDCPVCSARP